MENWKKKMNKVIEDLEAMNFTDLPEMEDISVIKNGVGKGIWIRASQEV